MRFKPQKPISTKTRVMLGVRSMAQQVLLDSYSKTLPKIVLIGFDGTPNDCESLAQTLSWLYEHHGIDHRMRVFRDLDCDVFNMAMFPERGDALDHIGADTDLVITFHLNFRFLSNTHLPSEQLSDFDRACLRSEQECDRIPGYSYNRNNHRLYDLCMNTGAMLACWGECPFDGIRLFGDRPPDDTLNEAYGIRINMTGGGPTGFLFEPTGVLANW